MPISFPMVILGSQLIVPVAEGVPSFDITRTCHAESAVSGLDAGLKGSVESCTRDEQAARTQLQTQWSQFPASDKSNCTQETGLGSTPSYVELLTCLQVASDARKLPKQ